MVIFSLGHILNKEVSSVNRNLSRRPNTFELYGKMSSTADINHVVNHIEGITLDYDPRSYIRYHMSADTSEEKNKWCTALMTVLDELRLWDYSMPPPQSDELH